MNLYQLSYFQTIVEAGSMSSAAVKLRISQSALSQSLKALEESIGQPLFERKGKTLLITEAGEILYKRMEIVSRQLHNARHEIEDLGKGIRGTVAWGAPELMSIDILKPVIIKAHKIMPMVNQRFRRSHSKTLKKWINTESINFAIIAGDWAKAKQFESKPLTKETFSLYISSKHPVLKDCKRFSLSQLENVPMLRTYQPRVEGIAEVDAIFAKKNFRPKIIHQVESFEMRRQMLLAGIAMGFFPKQIMQKDVEKGRVKCISQMGKLDLTFYLVVKKGRYIPKAPKRFIEILKDEFE